MLSPCIIGHTGSHRTLRPPYIEQKLNMRCTPYRDTWTAPLESRKTWAEGPGSYQNFSREGE